MKNNVPFLFLLLLIPGVPARAQMIVAHRGASHDAPENTLAAFELAWKEGADAIEGDFYLTRDDRIVCIHDKTTKRTTGVDLKVADSTFEQLRKLEYGSWKGKAWAGEPIPTLEEVLATVPRGKKILIEVKCGPEIVVPLQRVLARSKLAPRQTIVIAFDDKVVAETKRLIPRIRAYWLTGYKKDKKTGKWSPSLDQVLETLVRCRADGLDTNCNFDIVNAAFVQAIRKKGLELHAWTVDDPAAAARLQVLGFDSITTNRPAFLRQNLLTRDLKKHLQVWLKLDGDLKDSSPHGRHGRMARGKAATYGPAVFGRGLDLAPRGGAVNLEYRLPDTGSLALWYHARPWYNYQTILDNGIDPDCWEMWIYESGQLKFRNHPKGAVVVHQFHRTGDVDEWHHIAVTWNRGDRTRSAVRLYVNGRLADSAGWGKQPWVEPGGTFYLGGGNSGNTPGNGIWDDVAVFDTVLGPADVRFLMNGGVGGLEP